MLYELSVLFVHFFYATGSSLMPLSTCGKIVEVRRPSRNLSRSMYVLLR